MKTVGHADYELGMVLELEMHQGTEFVSTMGSMGLIGRC